MDLETLFRRDSDAPDALREGRYRWNRQGHVPLPVRVWYGPPVDREWPALLDRSPRWQVWIDGVPLDDYAERRRIEPHEALTRFWPKCAGSPLSAGDYRYLLAMARYARRHDGFSPFASRSGKVDLLSATIPEPGA